MKKILFTSFLIIAISGCNTNVENSIISKVKKECNNNKNTCLLNLSNVTTFKWDQFYLLQAWTTSDSIAIFTGLPYHGNDVQDDHIRMLFVYKNEIVHEEDFESLSFRKSTIAFRTDSGTILYTANKYIKPAEAKFKVEISHKKNRCDNCFSYNLFLLKDLN